MAKSLIDMTDSELNTEYDLLFERLKNMPNDLRLFPRIRDRARSLLNLRPEGRVTSRKRLTLERFPKHVATDYEADKLIETIGPEAAGNMIKLGMDRGIHNA